MVGFLVPLGLKGGNGRPKHFGVIHPSRHNLQGIITKAALGLRLLTLRGPEIDGNLVRLRNNHLGISGWELCLIHIAHTYRQATELRRVRGTFMMMMMVVMMMMMMLMAVVVFVVYLAASYHARTYVRTRIVYGVISAAAEVRRADDQRATGALQNTISRISHVSDLHHKARFLAVVGNACFAQNLFDNANSAL